MDFSRCRKFLSGFLERRKWSQARWEPSLLLSKPPLCELKHWSTCFVHKILRVRELIVDREILSQGEVKDNIFKNVYACLHCRDKSIRQDSLFNLSSYLRIAPTHLHPHTKPCHPNEVMIYIWASWSILGCGLNLNPPTLQRRCWLTHLSAGSPAMSSNNSPCAKKFSHNSLRENRMVQVTAALRTKGYAPSSPSDRHKWVQQQYRLQLSGRTRV